MPNPFDALRRDLRPCPHCGGPAHLEKMPRTDLWFRVRCADFKCGGTTWPQSSEDQATAIWNRRDGQEA